MLRGLEHSTETHAVVLNAIVVNGLESAMGEFQSLSVESSIQKSKYTFDLL